MKMMFGGCSMGPLRRDARFYQISHTDAGASFHATVIRIRCFGSQ
jgi:hypothetical protein